MKIQRKSLSHHDDRLSAISTPRVSVKTLNRTNDQRLSFAFVPSIVSSAKLVRGFGLAQTWGRSRALPADLAQLSRRHWKRSYAPASISFPTFIPKEINAIAVAICSAKRTSANFNMEPSGI